MFFISTNRWTSEQETFFLLDGTKTSNKRTSNFFLDAFYAHKNAVFFIFYAYLTFRTFYVFCACKIFS